VDGAITTWRRRAGSRRHALGCSERQVRREIEAIYPEIFHDFNERMWTPGGFRRPMPAARREWKTPNKKANFIKPSGFDENPDMDAEGRQVLRLMTLRSDDQFNTTIYTLDDRFRGVFGTRRVLLVNPDDIERLGFRVGDHVTAFTVANDGVGIMPRAVRCRRRNRFPSCCSRRTAETLRLHLPVAGCRTLLAEERGALPLAAERTQVQDHRPLQPRI
jgi:anaerobic selenocysteine-containing dehydrogenase